jgi:mgtE-like transporter
MADQDDRRAPRKGLDRARRARPNRGALAWLGDRVAGDRAAFVQSLVALSVNSTTSLVAGLVLGAITGTLEDIPGLLVMIPAAIGLRGNIFSAFGNRLSTASHLGTLRFTTNPRSLLGQNVAATIVLTLVLSAAFAVLAKAVAAGLGLTGTASVLTLTVVSVLGGLLASLVVLVASLGLALGARRFGWDLDNLVAPVVSTLGDVLTLPALWLAAFAVGHGAVTDALGGALVLLGAGSLVWALRSGWSVLVEIMRQSLPVLVVAGTLSTFAGVVIEKRLDTLVALPMLLILFPAFTSSAGALGGVLASRMSTNLHTGLVSPTTVPSRQAREDMASMLVLALPVYLLNGLGGWALGQALGEAGPPLTRLLPAVVVGGLLAVAFVCLVAYYGTVSSFRTSIDPDTVGIPVVTSSVDFVGALLFVSALTLVGVL